MDDVAGTQADRIEIRVLGPLRVRRADGVLVDPKQWRTGQTADLLRLLALHVDTPVPVDVLLEALWPAVDSRRGRASLRTAASRIRKVLGGDCLERRLGGLVLRDAWVDARALTMLAQDARRHVLSGEPLKVVAAAREAEPLYLHQIRWSVGDAEWAVRERDALEAAFRQLLADAADAAVSLSWWYDALDLAEHSILLEPLSERGYRAIMRSHRGLGETSRALQAYGQCRSVLAEELGADPSAETQALHRELLTETQTAVPVPAFSGRARELRWLQEVASVSGAAPLVCLVGGAGSGKTRLMQEAWPAGSGALRLSATGDDPTWTSLEDLLRGAAPPAVLLVDDAHRLPQVRIDALADVHGVPVVVAGRLDPAHRGLEQLVERFAEHGGAPAHQLHLPPLEQDEAAALCEVVLRGPVTEDLVRAVLREAQLPGEVIDLLRGWAGRGRVAATRDGLVLVQADRADALRLPRTRLLTEAVDQLAGEELELLHLVAVMGRPVAPEVLLPLLGPSAAGETAVSQRTWVARTLDVLVDRALLVPTDGGFTTCEPLLRDALLAWLRPSALRRLHRTVAERAHIPASARIVHWQGAGEPELAQAAALEASADALSEGQYEQALPHLRRLSALTATPESVPSDRLEVSERLGDVYGALGRPHEARLAYADAIQVAQAAQLPDLDRVDGKLRGAEEAALATGLQPPSPGVAGIDLSMDLGVGTAVGHDVEQRLTAAMQAADASPDEDRQAEVRMLLAAHVCVPRRQFRGVHRWTTEALERAASSSQQARALLVGWLPGAVLGNALGAEPRLRSAAGLLATGQDPATAAHVAALRALVAHDLGRPDLDERLAEASDAGSFDDASDHRWVLVRIATERGDLTSAQAWDGVPASGSQPPLVRQLRALASAALAAELGQPDRARGHLLDVIDLGDESGATLLVPEAAARLVVLEVSSDPHSARERFELFEWAVGADRLSPRESVLRHVARGAMRAADGRYHDAAVAASAAADGAERAGLVLLAAEAHRYRAIHLAEAGRRSESRLASAAASRSYEAAGARAWVDRAEADSRRVWSVGSSALSKNATQLRPDIRLLRGTTPP
jgi:DNA-binding SARP family transcriptional activator